MVVNWRKVYSTLLSLVAIGLLALGITQTPGYTPLFSFFLLLILAIFTQSTVSSLVGGTVSLSVSSAISLAAAPLYGPVAAAFVAMAAEVGLWVINSYTDRPNWQRAVERLGVNTGMNGVSAFLAGGVLVITADWLGPQTVWGATIPWLLAALVGDQVNLWLLTVIIYLAHGVKPLTTWKENQWAIPINVLVMSVGGGLLSLAVREFGLLGVAIFFLPIVLSSYSFRLTTNATKKQMTELEGVVALRTKDLADANSQLGEKNQQLGEANDQLENANQTLAGLHKEKDAFLAVLTHDMRTPLTSIKGYASILRDRELPREQQIKICKVILQSQETLLEIVNNILEIEKLQSGTPVLLEYSQFDLALLLKTTAETLEAPAQERHIQMVYDPVPSPILINADMQKIQRVLLNLVSNAVKYTPEGGRVQVEVGVNGRFATVCISDNGYGIPADELPYIFNRFTRAKKHQSMAVGTGLGLAIVKSFVDAHNGEIVVQSEEGVGSTFTVTLPL